MQGSQKSQAHMSGYDLTDVCFLVCNIQLSRCCLCGSVNTWSLWVYSEPYPWGWDVQRLSFLHTSSRDKGRSDHMRMLTVWKYCFCTQGKWRYVSPLIKRAFTADWLYCENTHWSMYCMCCWITLSLSLGHNIHIKCSLKCGFRSLQG